MPTGMTDYPTDQGAILVIGEALIDCFHDTRMAGGAPFNVARNLGALGASPDMITRIGDDNDGALLRDECRRFHISQDGLQCDPKLPTGRVEVSSRGTEHIFAIAENAAWDWINPQVAKDFARRVQPSIVCFGTLAQRAAESRAAVTGILNGTPALRVLDLNLRRTASDIELARWSLAHADIAKVNDAELMRLIEWFVPDFAISAGDEDVTAYAEAIAQLLLQFPLRHFIVTQGANGYAAFNSTGRLVANGPSPGICVTDTVGAGDAFTAIVVFGEWLGWPLSVTLGRASHFAASVCTLRGAVSSDMAFYQPWIERWQLAQPRRQPAASA